MSGSPCLGEFELMVLLALLRLGDDAYGVPICHEIEKRGGREAVLGRVYAALERLEERGLVTSQSGGPTAVRGGRPKRYFRITAQGMRDFRQTRPMPVNLWRGFAEPERGPA